MEYKIEYDTPLWQAIDDLRTRVASLEARKSKSGPRKRKTTTEKLEPYSAPVRQMVQKLYDVWPSQRIDGSTVRNDVVDAASNVELILKSYPDLALEQLEAAAAEWLEQKPDYPNAIQFWFGPGKSGEPPWMRGVRALRSRGIK